MPLAICEDFAAASFGPSRQAEEARWTTVRTDRHQHVVAQAKIRDHFPLSRLSSEIFIVVYTIPTPSTQQAHYRVENPLARHQ